MSKPFWQGVFPAITTQLKRDQSLDLEATASHAEALINSDVDGLIFLGSLGENQALHPAEKRLVLEAMVKAVRGRIPVLSGVAESSTAEACAYAREMEKLGATGLMVMPAMLYKGDENETLAHFRAVAHASALPIMVYNNPLSYANDITPEMFARLAEEKNFVALKESSGDARRITDLRNTVGDRYAIFSGVDDLILEASILGIDGWVAGIGQAFPLENHHFWQLTRTGKWDEARQFYRWFTPLLHLDTHTKFVQYIKLAVQECGLGQEWVRAPRLPLAGAERERILQIIRRGMETRPPTSSKKA
jgi:4-hydroxy-tetrahydrodipicolinate synthase